MHAMQLLSSMLWAFKGTTRSTWTTASPDEADVIVFHRDDQDERVADLLARGKLAVEIATLADRDSPGSRALVYPFRAAQALELLERLDMELASGEDLKEAVGRHLETLEPQARKNDPWSFVEALRATRALDDPHAWLVASTAEAPIIWVRARGTTYLAAPATVQTLRLGALKLTDLELRQGAPPTEHSTPRHEAELSWFAAYHASDRLAPWLSPSARYRITRWPDFGAIRPAASQIRVVAALAAVPSDLLQIAERAHVPTEEAVRTLNALATSGSVIIADPGTAPAPAVKLSSMAAESRGGLTAFLRNVRKHLGLGVRT